MQEINQPRYGGQTNIGFIPIGPRVVIKPDAVVERQSEGGIILPLSSQSKSHRIGVVVAVGPGTKDEPNRLQLGDVVTYSPANVEVLELYGTTYAMTVEPMIHGVDMRETINRAAGLQ
jgi:chaperonin GroES